MATATVNLFEAARVEEVKSRLARSGALFGGNRHGDGQDTSSAAHLHWTAAGAVGEKVIASERRADAPQCDDREELPRNR